MSDSKKVKELVEKYEDMINYDQLSVILDVPRTAFNHYVKIFDFCEDDENAILSLFHYRQDLVEDIKRFSDQYNSQDRERIKRVRGKIVCLNTMELVCGSYPYTCVIPMSKIQEEGAFESPPIFIDDEGNPEYVYSEEIICNKRIVGAALRAFRVGNNCYLSSHKRIKTKESRFGDSDSFEDLFFEQHIFKIKDDIFKNSDPERKFIYMFMVSSLPLNIDSQQVISENKVYFLASFEIVENSVMSSLEEELRMKDEIHSLNEVHSKKIEFPEILSREESNRILNPVSSQFEDISELTNEEIFNVMTSCEDRNLVRRYFFQPSEDIIVRTGNGGIYTISAPASIRRRQTIDGNTQLMKIFANHVGMFKEKTLKRSEIFVPYGYPEDILRIFGDILMNGGFPRFEEYEEAESTIFEIISTNLLFTVPRYRIDEVLQLIPKYNVLVAGAVNFIFSRRDKIFESIIGSNFANFPGVKGKKEIINYFKSDFCACFFKYSKDGRKTLNDIIGDGPRTKWWPEFAVDMFKEDEKRLKTKKTNVGKKVDETEIHMAIIAFVCNAGKCMYAMLKFKDYVESYEAAKEKSRTLIQEEDV